MLEHSERLLRIACLCLAAVLLYQLAGLLVRKDPLANLSIPALPALPPAAEAQTVGSQTNSPSRQTQAKSATNSPARQETAQAGTNSAPTQNLAATGQVSVSRSGPGVKEVKSGVPPEMAMMAMNPMLRTASGMKAPALPPAVQARVDRITESELLAPIIRPLPMALLGIAGANVFLRAPNGQTGLVKEGEEVGGVKLLRIGVNRVLVELEGQKKELMIFAGFGGETLLPKEKENLK